MSCIFSCKICKVGTGIGKVLHNKISHNTTDNTQLYIQVVLHKCALAHTNLLVVVQRCPVVPTLANKTAGTTKSKSASSSTMKSSTKPLVKRTAIHMHTQTLVQLLHYQLLHCSLPILIWTCLYMICWTSGTWDWVPTKSFLYNCSNFPSDICATSKREQLQFFVFGHGFPKL